MKSVEKLNGLIKLAKAIGTFTPLQAQLTNLIIAELILYLWGLGEREEMEATILTSSPNGWKWNTVRCDLLLLTSKSSGESVCVPLTKLNQAFLISVLKAVAFYGWEITERTTKDYERLDQPELTPHRFLIIKDLLVDLLGKVAEDELDQRINALQDVIPTPLFANGGMRRITEAASATATGSATDAWASAMNG